MTDEDAFIQEILANPNDVTARLIYADWLDERNDPRGKYLRQLVAAQSWNGDTEGRLRDASLTLDRIWVEQMHRRLTRAGLEGGVFEAHASFNLDSGRTITLHSLQQSFSAGLLEGIPTKKTNNKISIEWAIQEARGGVADRRVKLIEPRRRDYLLRPGDHAGIKFMGEPPEFLPAVTCIGVFGDAYSELAVVWFQEEFALPIAENVLSQIRKLDWASEARHWTAEDLASNY